MKSNPLKGLHPISISSCAILMNDSKLSKVYLVIADFNNGSLSFKTFNTTFVTLALSAIPIIKSRLFTE